MGRTINKNMSSSTVYAIDANKPIEQDENGVIVANMVFQVEGVCSENKARIRAEKLAGHKNVMIMFVDVDETKLTVNPDVFYYNSSPCRDGVSYGREYVTQSFTNLSVNGLYKGEDGILKPFVYNIPNEMADSRVLSYMREAYGKDAVILNIERETEKRYMLRTKYIELATA